MTNKISRFPIPERNELPEDIQELMNGAEAQLGFVPNVVSALSYKPAELRAFMGYNNAFTKPEEVTDAEREMMIVAFSAANGCSYCVMSHGSGLRQITGNPQIADQVAINYKEADITERERAVIDFGMKISFEPASVDEKDFEILRSHGISDDGIWYLAAEAAFYNMSNRMMSFAAVRPDDAYYTMGR